MHWACINDCIVSLWQVWQLFLNYFNLKAPDLKPSNNIIAFTSHKGDYIIIFDNFSITLWLMIFLFNCDTTRVRTYLLVNSLPTNVTRLIKSIESVGTGKLDQVLILEPSPSARHFSIRILFQTKIAATGILWLVLFLWLILYNCCQLIIVRSASTISTVELLYR